MKSIEDIIDNHSTAYRWEDGTLDICLEDNHRGFLYQVNSHKCLRCSTPLIEGNESRIADITEYIKGIKLECNSCALKYFIHQQVTFDVD